MVDLLELRIIPFKRAKRAKKFESFSLLGYHYELYDKLCISLAPNEIIL